MRERCGERERGGRGGRKGEIHAKVDADKAKVVFKNFAGEPVDWPAQSDLEAGRSASRLRLQRLLHLKSQGEDEDESDSSDANFCSREKHRNALMIPALSCGESSNLSL